MTITANAEVTTTKKSVTRYQCGTRKKTLKNISKIAIN